MEKYQPLTEKIQNMWQKDKVIVVPFVISSTGIFTDNIHKIIEHLQLKRSTGCTHEICSRGSSGSIVSDYGLDDWGSIPERSRGFFFWPLRPDQL
jgi:hypothetical protein